MPNVLTNARQCPDSATQVMTAADPGDMVTCGCCGKRVTVLETPLRPADPSDHNTVRVLADHAAPARPVSVAVSRHTPHTFQPKAADEGSGAQFCWSPA